MICGAGMFNALLLSYSRLPCRLAEDGLLPGWLALRHPKTGAPWVSIVACSLAYAACLGIGFKRLVELDLMLYGTSLGVEFAALIVLRLREPSMPRPFKVPGGLVVGALLGVGPMGLLLMAMWDGRGETIGPFSTFSLGALLMAGGPMVYLQRRKRAEELTAGAVVPPEG